jgi:hypothetical protein
VVKKPPTNLHLVVDEVYQLGVKPETTTARVKRLQTEARMLAREQIEALEKSMEGLAGQAAEVAQGGEAYPAGVRDLAERLAEDLEQRMMTMKALMARLPEPKL